MRISSKILTSIVLAAGIMVLARHGMYALRAEVPKDMPSNSHFIQSGYDLRRNEPQGNWISCRPDFPEEADFCRVTDARGVVIYQGDFLALGGSQAVSQANLRFATTDPRNLWVRGPAENGPVPVIHLANGQILVPAGDSDALADRWARDPDELARLEAPN